MLVRFDLGLKTWVLHEINTESIVSIKSNIYLMNVVLLYRNFDGASVVPTVLRKWGALWLSFVACGRLSSELTRP
jgi:hypothetical protein